MEKALKNILFFLTIIILLILLGYLLGFDPAQNVLDLKEKITEKRLNTNLSCSKIRSDIINMYSGDGSFNLNSKLDRYCKDECRDKFNLKYQVYDMDHDECLDGENLICICHNPH